MLAGIKDAAKSAGPGLVALWLFGSVAHGEDRTNSDLDLALVFHNAEHCGGDNAPHCRDAPESMPRLADAFRDGVAALGKRAGFAPSAVTLGTDDVARLSAEHDPWWRQVVRDAIALIGERPDALAARLTPAAALCSQSS